MQARVLFTFVCVSECTSKLGEKQINQVLVEIKYTATTIQE